MIRNIFFILILCIIFVLFYRNQKFKESYNDYGDCLNTNNFVSRLNDEEELSNANDVFVLGKLGITPWGNCPGFSDRNAEWIWFTPNGKTTAPGENFGGASFLYNYFNKKVSNINAKINVIADNQCYIKVNDSDIGIQRGGWGSKGGLFNITLKPGINTFVLNATNLGDSPNPAGLLVSVLDDSNQILFSSGSGWKYIKHKPLNKRITSADECSKAGGYAYNYCSESDTHYCCGVCGEKATCSNNSGLLNCACKEASKSGNSSVCPTNYPYEAYGGKICYTKEEYAEKGSGPCESWCTNDKNFGSGCGNPAFKLCSNLSVSNNEENCFDLDYMNKRKVLIAISFKSGENTYENTKNQCLGIIQQNKQSHKAYETSQNNINNELYSSVYIYTGKRGDLAENDIYKSSSHSVNLLPKWLLIQYNNYYFIKNIDNNRYLGYGNTNYKTKDKIIASVYMSPEKDENGNWALTEYNLWDIKKVKCNTYTIQHKITNKYLSSTKPSIDTNFVTNVYSTSEPKIKPNYNKYGDVYCNNNCFQWFIAPLPPYKGYWHSTIVGSPGFLPGFSGNCSGNNFCEWNTTPYPMRPCSPSQLNGKQIPYPWFQAMEGNSGVCLNATGCRYVQNKLIWKRLKLTLTIGNGTYDDTSQLNELYLTNNNKQITNTAELSGKYFKREGSTSVEFMIGLKQPYVNGLYIKVGNDGTTITKIVLEVYNDGSWQTILSNSQERVWVKNQSHQYTFDTVTL